MGMVHTLKPAILCPPLKASCGNPSSSHKNPNWVENQMLIAIYRMFRIIIKIFVFGLE
jgi:hypothetical protein